MVTKFALVVFAIICSAVGMFLYIAAFGPDTSAHAGGPMRTFWALSGSLFLFGGFACIHVYSKIDKEGGR